MSLYTSKTRSLGRRIEELKKQANRYTDVEDTLHETLAYVKQSSTDMRQAAEETAARIIDEAKKEAEWILGCPAAGGRRDPTGPGSIAFRSRVRRQLESQLRQLLGSEAIGQGG
jgi:hypothetical protein